MSRKVKCKATGEWGTNETFYRPDDVKFYFKDEEIYKQWKIKTEENKNRVKCFITKESGTKDTYYFDEKTKHYFKSKEVFDNWRDSVEKKKAVNDMIADFVGYHNGEVFPTVMTKKVKELVNIYDIFTVYDTFVEKREDIQLAMDTKEFGSELHKCSYIIAIIVNNINDVWKRRKREEKMAIKREAVLESEDIDAEFDFMPLPVSNKNDRDISRFLEDGTWN